METIAFALFHSQMRRHMMKTLKITNNSYSADRIHKWRAHNQRELMISFIKAQGNATITQMHHDGKTQYINSHTTSTGKTLVFISHNAMGLSVIMAFPGHTHSFFIVLQMEGLWYEIARTRFTFNKMESVISYHRYDPDDNLIKSYYTGTTYVSTFLIDSLLFYDIPLHEGVILCYVLTSIIHWCITYLVT